jgi:hypothetical protein
MTPTNKKELAQKIFFGFIALIFSSILVGIISVGLSREAEEIQERKKAVESVSTVVNWHDQKY